MDTVAPIADVKRDLVTEFRKRAFVGRDLAAIDEYLADDFVDHFAPPSDPPGREGVRHRLGRAAEGFHTEGVDVLLHFERGDYICQVINIRMRHTGDFMGVAATNKLVRIGGFDAFHIRNGKLQEHWGVYDVSKLPDAVGQAAASWDQMWSGRSHP